MKKKIGLLILSFVFLFPCHVKATVAVMDMDSNRILYGVSKDEKKLIASTTKILTAMITIQNVDIKEKVTVTQSVLASYGSGIYIEVGEEMSVEDLLYGLMLRSGNDAAIMLAEYVGGSMEGFATLMNELASSIGMKNSHFINASGLENESGEGNMSTAADMALLMSYAMKNETFRKITKTKHHVVKTNYKTYDWYNKNKLLDLYPYTTGGKTGYTEKAYRTLVTSATKDGKNLTVVTLDERDDFAIHQSLYEEYFKKYKAVQLLDKKTFMKEEGAYIEEDFSMLLLDSEIKEVEIEVTKLDDVTNRYGIVTVSLDGKEYFRTDIFYKTKEEKIGFFKKVKLFFQNLFS